MDPYLEDPAIWPDFHHRWATILSEELNNELPAPFYARMEMRPELGIVEESEEKLRSIVPDVLILRHPNRTAGPGTGGPLVMDAPRREAAPAVEFTTLPDELVRHHFVEIRDSQRGHKLVTLIEILSPSNKRPGPDRDSYAAKQREVLESDANLVEIDLLRTGRRVLPSVEITTAISRLEPQPDYLVLISRAWRRSRPLLGYSAYPIRLREMLPCISVPLVAEQAEVPLDLQFAFQRTYDGGPYRRGAVDYSETAHSLASAEDAAWADSLLREQGWRSSNG
jgi:hypothetical protein